MKSVKIFILLFLMILSAGSAIAQTEEMEDPKNTIDFLNYNTTFSKMLVQNGNPADQVSTNSEVFIQQIGQQNKVHTSIHSSFSSVGYSQTGNFNEISNQVTAEKVQFNIVQEGNRNNTFDFSYDPNQEISLNLTQNGNDLHFARFGSNSIGNDLQFKMEGNSKTIIVKNFK